MRLLEPVSLSSKASSSPSMPSASATVSRGGSFASMIVPSAEAVPIVAPTGADSTMANVSSGSSALSMCKGTETVRLEEASAGSNVRTPVVGS